MVAPTSPRLDPGAEGVLFVVAGGLTLTLATRRTSWPRAATPSSRRVSAWTLHNRGEAVATFHWIRKAYQVVEGIEVPAAVRHQRVRRRGRARCPAPTASWTTQRFADPSDIRHDMHVNIVNFEPGGAIPFPETHVMEHGLYVLEGKAVYLLNNDWVEVQEGDFMWLRAFCPQACYAGGPGRFRYLLYKDVNRHAVLSRQFV